MLEELLVQLSSLEHLTEGQVCLAVEQLVNETAPVEVKAQFLTHLALKGETELEIACFVRELRKRAVQPALNGQLRAREILDVVGTGGDRLSTFNISTTAALLASAAGIVVAKHGNRASTSLVGSADVMDALGIPFDLGPEEAARSLQEHGFAFFFAPKYHPAFRHIIPARKLCAERGQSTIFNLLGPLLNPASPSAMLIGVPRPELCLPLARVVQALGVRRAMVVCGSVADGPDSLRYLDEISPLGPTVVAEFYQENAITTSSLSPQDFPLQPATLADLQGGDGRQNAAIIRQILCGQERGPKRDAALLNTAAALFVAGRADSISTGLQLAASVIDSGLAARKLLELSKA
ncbi:MAG TPA: anthranilate phosphoribosyltransferase [Verrucomicrobiae bacterium]|nr:anthranilate phosphoribosyltransferase [Verrucomicrobiae bacterium]